MSEPELDLDDLKAEAQRAIERGDWGLPWIQRCLFLISQLERTEAALAAVEGFLRHEEWVEGEKDPGWWDGAWEGVVTPVLAKICSAIGHQPIPDHCGKPEHDFCARCRAPTPGQA